MSKPLMSCSQISGMPSLSHARLNALITDFLLYSRPSPPTVKEIAARSVLDEVGGDTAVVLFEPERSADRSADLVKEEAELAAALEPARAAGELLRGGFLLCDSFFGSSEWLGFETTMKRVFPDRPIVELPADHPIFHIVYDLTERPQVPNWQHLRQGRGGYRDDGAVPRWRAILDDGGRVMVMIAFNNDIADGWQRADEPGYPQDKSTLAIRLGVNFAVYAMTH